MTKNRLPESLVVKRLGATHSSALFDERSGANNLGLMNPDSASAIRLNLCDLAQLFNSMDSSPFVDRDLDEDAERFIMNWARELPPGDELKLVINLGVLPSADRIAGVEDAVQRYFATRTAIKQLEFSQLMRRGRLSLGVGVLFLILCLLLGELANKAGAGSLVGIVQEGLTIAGWVAMWRPLEIYLYDWWPIYEERRRLARLARIKVTILAPKTALPRLAEMEGGVQASFSESAA